MTTVNTVGQAPEKSIHNLKLHESIWIDSISKNVIRVPGGWIYESWDQQKDEPITDGIFVPHAYH